MDTRDYLSEYYNAYDEDDRLLTRHGQVEYMTTMTYIARYLRPGVRILEIGAGTGRYSHALARQGYAVDAVELVQRNIDLFRQNTLPGESVSIRQGNALNLSCFSDETYDLVLLLGPMYHLYTREEQRQALSEAVRVAKRDGVIFAAYCMSDASILQYGFGRDNIHELIAQHKLDPETFETFSRPQDLFELYRKQDIEALRGSLPVSQLHFVAADGYACHMREKLAQMTEDVFALYLRYHLATCERPDLIGYSNHTLDIFRKQ